MAYIKRPQRGQKTLQSLFDSVNSIIDYLPTITIRGDNYSTYVEQSSNGTIVHAKQPYDTDQTGGGKKYYAGSGISITSGNIINAFLSAGPNIKIYSNSGCLVISGTPVGSGGVGPDTNTTYIGEKQATCSCGFIYVDPNPISGDTHVIYSTLRYIGQLYNFPIDSETTPEYEHYLQVTDLKAGAGTEINYHYYSAGNHEADDPNAPLIKVIDGIEVDLNVSGGTYITTNFHKGVGYGDQTSASIDCNLSGDKDAYSTGFITIVPQRDLSQNITGGIISTCLHGDGSTISIDSNGTISCLVEGGGGGGPDTNTTYTGELDVPYSDGGCPCGFIHVGQTPFSGDTHIIYSTLRNLYQLGNEGITSNDHFVQAADIKAGIGTEINYHYNVDTPTAAFIDGFEVDLNISGGNFITTNLTRNQDQVSASIDCNLSGDRDAYATGLISIIPQRDLASNITGGIISTCLHGDESTIHVDEGTGTISCLVQGGSSWTSLTPSLLAVDNNNHTLSAATQSGGGGGSTGVPWPNYANLHNSGNSISIQTDYTADSQGGWLRISYKGTATDNQCHSLMMDGYAIGMYTLNSMLGQIGNTWILPIPPFSRFMVNFPSDKTYAYFDGSLYDSGDVQTIYATLIADCEGAYEAAYYANENYNYAKGKADWAENDYTVYSQNNPPNIDPPRDYWNNYCDARDYVNGYVDPQDSDYNISGAVQYAAEAQQYSTLASTEATRMKNNQEDILNRADSYAISAANCYTSASNSVTAASGEADRVYKWYLSACNLSGVTPHAKTYPNRDQ